MIKLFFAFFFILALLFPAAFSQRANGSDLKKIAFVNEAAFEDEKTGIKKLAAAYQFIESADCFPQPCSLEQRARMRKMIVEPVLSEISDALNQIERQNNLIILRAAGLDSKNMLLAVNWKFDVSSQFIAYFNNNKTKSLGEFLKLDLPAGKIAVMDAKQFADERNGIKRFSKLIKKPDEEKESINVMKAIKAFAAENEIALVFSSNSGLPPELEKYPVYDVTKEFISYYNQINP